MANEDKKDFNAMLNDSKDMPKFQMITDEKSIEKYGGNRMYFAPPIDYDKVMRLVPFGKLLTVGAMQQRFARSKPLSFCLCVQFPTNRFFASKNEIRINTVLIH